MNGKSKMWALALLVGVLLLGGAAGAAADRVLADETACSTADSRGDRGSYLDWLAAELDLTDEQRAQAETTVERHRERISALWREVRPRFEQMKAELRQEIQDGLTQEQQARYDELLKSQPKRWRHGKARKH